jgi:hypothetical protein
MLDNRSKLVIDENGIKLMDESIIIPWENISDIKLCSKTIRKFDLLNSSSYSNVNANCITIYTINKKKVEKVIERYAYSKKELNMVLDYYRKTRLHKNTCD